MSFSRCSSQLRDQNSISHIGKWILYHCTTWEGLCQILPFSTIKMGYKLLPFLFPPEENPQGSGLMALASLYFPPPILHYINSKNCLMLLSVEVLTTL